MPPAGPTAAATAAAGTSDQMDATDLDKMGTTDLSKRGPSNGMASPGKRSQGDQATSAFIAAPDGANEDDCKDDQEDLTRYTHVDAYYVMKDQHAG